MKQKSEQIETILHNTIDGVIVYKKPEPLPPKDTSQLEQAQPNFTVLENPQLWKQTEIYFVNKGFQDILKTEYDETLNEHLKDIKPELPPNQHEQIFEVCGTLKDQNSQNGQCSLWRENDSPILNSTLNTKYSLHSIL